MNYHPDVSKIKKESGGYVALMATLVISVFLLVMAVEEGSSGWYSRFNILGTEAKEQASALAEGCADQALAAVITDPGYSGDATTTTIGGTCHVYPVEFNTPAVGLVTIKTQADVRDSYANLAIEMNLNQIHLGTPTPGKGTLIVVTQVINNGSGSKVPADFSMSVTATNPPQTNFPGADTGVAITMDAGSYVVTETSLPGYTSTVSTNCSSTITAGQIKFCTITNDDITTTLTVVANVTNDNSGTNVPADFPLTIDGVPATIGTRYTVTGGSHTVGAATLSGYSASSWGYDCSGSATISVATGQSKTCVININDDPLPAPSCADSVMILDRTGSMSSADLTGERNAAASLVNLYASVLPPALPPQLGVGSIGAYPNQSLPAGAAGIPLVGQLSTIYTNLTTVIGQITGSNSIVGSNLAAGITTAAAELNSLRHVVGKQKVLILVSDGVPNEPSGSTAYDTGFLSATSSEHDAAGSLWNSPTNAYTNGAGDATSSVTGSADRERYFTFGFGNGAGLPVGSTVDGIEASIDAWNTSSAIGVTATTTLTPNTSGSYDQWTANTGSDGSAVSTNDSDTSYIDTSTSIDTFSVANAGIPAGSIINSVTLTAVAKSIIAGAPLQFVAEKGGVFSIGSTNTLTTSYTTYTRTMNTDPSGATWTISEVNAWSTKFGVRTTAGAAVARVTQFFVTVNYSPGGSTGLRSPTTTSGSSNNQFINPTRAFASDNSYATDVTNGHVQGYATFALGVPVGATIAGIDVAVEARSTDSSGCQVGVELASNGSTFTSSGSVTSLATSDSVYSLGGTNNLWGRAWIPSDVNASTFTVRLRYIDPGNACTNGSTLSIDQIQARVYYNLPAVNTSTLLPVSGGSYDQWTSNTGSDVSATAGNDGDTSYIDTSASVDTFEVPNAAVPAGSVIDAVVISVIAKGTANGAPLQLVVENGGTPNIGATNSLTTGYSTYSRTMTTDPLTGAAWTLAKVNAWTTKFGVRTTVAAAVARVTQFSVSVVYTPTPSPTACQIGMDLSWNGGATWSTEKTQTLTGTEATYVLGSASDDWSSSHTWGPTEFSNANFRARVHAIDQRSSCDNSALDHLDWLQVKVDYMQTVDPTQASLNAADAAKLAGIDLFTIHFGDVSGQMLLAQLASGSNPVSGHQPGSLAQAGGIVTGDSGFIAPTAVTSPNQWMNPTRAYASDNSYATDAISGHQQGYTTFGFSIPPTATINGIALSVEAKSSDNSGCQVAAELSSDNGASFTTSGSGTGVTGSDAAHTLGGVASLWGRTWVADDFSNGKFVVRLQDIDPGNACTNGSTLSTDQIRARVYYTVNNENSDGDNFFIAPTSADMQGIFNFIGEQVCPAALNLASAPPPTTGTLIIMTQVINNNGGAETSMDFIARVSATNPSQSSFAGVASGVAVTVSPGSYNITENSVTGYNEIPGATCSSAIAGAIAAGETRVCVLTNDDIPPPPPPPDFNVNTGSWQEIPTAQ